MSEEVWIYHERQQALLCGQHALNNLVQNDVFTYGSLSTIAHRLDELELRILASSGGTQSAGYQARLREGSGNVDPQGNFSIQVLKVALEERYGVQLTHALSEDMIQTKQLIDITDMQGFICHKSNHWFAIRHVGGRFWNLNSMDERPTPISHFDLATRVEGWHTDGYTIFCVPSGLPPVGALHGHAGVHWHRMADLVQGRSTDKDPFDSMKGKGLRLDGKSSNAISNLSEEEQLAMALQQSVESIGRPSLDCVIVPDEPPASDQNAVRIQFRLPDKRCVRRFHRTDSVDMVYASCQQMCKRAVVLKCGFPLKEIPRGGQTIESAGLANESIQAVYL